MYHAVIRLGLGWGKKRKRPPRKARRYPELLKPGEKVQIDVKKVPYHCLKGAVKRDGKHLYQWTVIDERIRLRFVYGYEEHTLENSIDFMERLLRAFPFPIQTVHTDNSTEFTCRFIDDKERGPFEEVLAAKGLSHKLSPPGTPWHNGKMERSHRCDQRYFYDWEKFASIHELSLKFSTHLSWYNEKSMRSLDWCTPLQRLTAFTGSYH